LPAISARPRGRTFALILVALAVVPALSRAGDGDEEDARPITVYADRVQGWTSSEHHGLYARGNVSVERGASRVRMKNAILWLSKPVPGSEVVTAILYGEDGVTFEESGKPKQTLDRLALHWRTLGELRVVAPEKAKGGGEPDAADPLYQRALQILKNPPPLNQGPPAEVLPPPVATPEKREAKGPVKQTVRQRDFNRDPVSPSPDVGSVLQRSSTLGIASRTSSPYQFKVIPTKPGETAIIIWGGITLFAGDEQSIVDISSDRAVLWVKGVGGGSQQGIPNFSNFKKEQIEVYLEGHVEIRYARTAGPSAGIQQLVLADRGYYDLGRNAALLANCELTYRLPQLATPVHLQAREIRQINLNTFQASEATFFASRLPSDPDIRILAGDVSLELRDVARKGLWGTTAFDPIHHSAIRDAQLYTVANNVQFRFMDVPIGYLSHVEGDARDPLGPLEDVRVKFDRVFGAGAMVRLDAFELLGMERPANTRWDVAPLFYSRRGPGLVSEFHSSGVGAFGFPGRYDTDLRAQVQWDYADTDILGKLRTPAVPQDIRGLAAFHHRQELDENWSFQTQIHYQSDRNFYEQWWKHEYDEDLNQETFFKLQYQFENFAMSGLFKPGIRNWANEGEALPRGDAWLVGQDLFRTLSYFGHASAGFYRFNTTSDLGPAYFATPFPDEFQRYRPLPPSSDMPHRQTFNLARFDFMNELDFPLPLGALNLTPYGLADAAFYTDDMSGQDAGRIWYGGGVRAALPLSRLYSDVRSDFFNVRGVYHKVSFEADYRWVQSDVDFRRLPLIDRLDDDPSDQARRDLRMYRLINGTRLDLATSPLYDPQLYALRRGYLDSPDNLDDMEYLRFGVRNRWQTKRGTAEAERTVDWISFDVFATYFPNESRDNYGHPFGLIDYDFRWQVGERTSIISQGYADPFKDGARNFSLGLVVDRTERLRFYLGYYKLDPVGTSAVVFNTTYVVNPKYTLSWSTSYDFGLGSNLGQSLLITRTGSDLQVGVGLGWDPLRNNFSATFEIYPTLLGPTRHMRNMAPGLAQLEPGILPY